MKRKLKENLNVPINRAGFTQFHKENEWANENQLIYKICTRATDFLNQADFTLCYTKQEIETHKLAHSIEPTNWAN